MKCNCRNWNLVYHYGSYFFFLLGKLNFLYRTTSQRQRLSREPRFVLLNIVSISGASRIRGFSWRIQSPDLISLSRVSWCGGNCDANWASRENTIRKNTRVRRHIEHLRINLTFCAPLFNCRYLFQARCKLVLSRNKGSLKPRRRRIPGMYARKIK